MKHVKRITAIVFSLIMLLSATAFAQQADGVDEKSAISEMNITIGYDSFFYKAKLFFENVRLINTFTSVGKANVSAIFAQRRMAEASLMAEQEDFDAAQSLMIEGVGLMSQATDYAVDAMMHKDNGRTRLVLENVNEAQANMLEFLDNVSAEYPDTFDTEQMTADINENVVDIMVVWAYVVYKENVFEDDVIRQNAIDALNNSESSDRSISLDAITSATQEFVEEVGEQLKEDAVSLDAGAEPAATDAVASATQTGTDGTQTGGTTVDGTSSATTTTGGTEPAPTDPNAVDATSSATTTTGGTDPAPSGTGGVDGTSSATPTGEPGVSLYYDDDDDEYEHDDDDEPEEHDDDESEEHDDDESEEHDDDD